MVFVLDKRKRPLMPCTEKRARLLLERGRAVVHKRFPFTIRLKDRLVEESRLQPLRLKLDPGAKVTGVAVLREHGKEEAAVVWMTEIHHKTGIKEKLKDRRDRRRSRRSRKTRYRKPRFLNRRRPEGWLPPSLEARVNQTLNAVAKLRKLLPITAISTEHVKFDTQLLQNPNISGVEYQQGTLWGYEVREYLLEKWGRKCAYCGATDVQLEVEHVVPRSRGGTDRVSNLTLACRECNEAKGNLLPQEWLEKLKKSRRAKDKERARNLEQVMQQLQVPLRDAAMVNATRWRLFERLKATGLPVECGTGARTKMQRIAHELPKTHYYDACCVGASTPARLVFETQYVDIWQAVGRGSRQIMQPDAYGFPRQYRSRQKRFFGFQTGDFVRVRLSDGRVVTGRVTVRKSGQFYIKDENGKRINFSYKLAELLQRGDGWMYARCKSLS